MDGWVDGWMGGWMDGWRSEREGKNKWQAKKPVHVQYAWGCYLIILSINLLERLDVLRDECNRDHHEGIHSAAVAWGGGKVSAEE